MGTVIRTAKFWKSKMAAGRHLGFTKILITHAWIELFGWNLNWIYPAITEIGKCHQKCEIVKSKMAAGRHLGFTKILITPAWIALLAEIWTAYPRHNRNWKISSEMRNRSIRQFSWNFNNIYSGETYLVIYVIFFKIQDGSGCHNRSAEMLIIS